MDLDRQVVRFVHVPHGNPERGQLPDPQRARLARQVQIIAPAGSSIANFVVNAEPIGSLSLENVGLLDLRVAKRFALGQGRNVELRLDCFNVTNVNPVTSIVTRAGTTFGNATASADGGQNGTGLTPPRIFQIETRFTF